MKAPANINDLKAFSKAVYSITDGGKVLMPRESREQCLLNLLGYIRQDIAELTNVTPNYKNHIKYDPNTAETATTVKERCRCDKSDLVLVMSAFDYPDLQNRISAQGQNAVLSDSLADAASGVTVIPISGLPPGCYFLGDNNILNFLMVLDHSGEVFHWREEERQWYTNYWFNFGVFTQQICGIVRVPCKNFNAGNYFYNKYHDLFKN